MRINTIMNNPEVQERMHALQAQLERTLAILQNVQQTDLQLPDQHGCAVGNTFGGLIAHNIEHDKMHIGQIATKRWELGVMQQDAAHRLIAELITPRAALIASLIGLPDTALDLRPEEGATTLREVIDHVLYWERDSMEHAAREVIPTMKPEPNTPQ